MTKIWGDICTSVPPTPNSGDLSPASPVIYAHESPSVRPNTLSYDCCRLSAVISKFWRPSAGAMVVLLRLKCCLGTSSVARRRFRRVWSTCMVGGLIDWLADGAQLVSARKWQASVVYLWTECIEFYHRVTANAPATTTLHCNGASGGLRRVRTVERGCKNLGFSKVFFTWKPNK